MRDVVMWICYIVLALWAPAMLYLIICTARGEIYCWRHKEEIAEAKKRKVEESRKRK